MKNEERAGRHYCRDAANIIFCINLLLQYHTNMPYFKTLLALLLFAPVIAVAQKIKVVTNQVGYEFDKAKQAIVVTGAGLFAGEMAFYILKNCISYKIGNF